MSIILLRAAKPRVLTICDVCSGLRNDGAALSRKETAA
jgi:hypothetical protein